MTFMEWLNRFTDTVVRSGSRPGGALQAAYEAGESPEDCAELAMQLLAEEDEGDDEDDDDLDVDDEEDSDEDDPDDAEDDDDEDDDDDDGLDDFRNVWQDDDD